MQWVNEHMPQATSRVRLSSEIVFDSNEGYQKSKKDFEHPNVGKKKLYLIPLRPSGVGPDAPRGAEPEQEARQAAGRDRRASAAARKDPQQGTPAHAG